jgi:ribosomal protein S18 acetylase RimI-like enzyme
VYPRQAHTASYEICHVAERDGAILGVMAAFPAPEGDRLARRFLGLTIPRMPAWRWPIVLQHLRASAKVTPAPPPDALYVDALAVADSARRQGVATALLVAADELARAAGAAGVALDTGIENTGAQAFYEAAGFVRRAEHRAPDARVARAVGGEGFVSFFRPV